MKYISFVESTVGTVKSVYRRKEPDGLIYVSVNLIKCKRAIDKDNKEDSYFQFFVGDKKTEKIVYGIKKGNIITIKEAANRIIQIKQGEYLPEQGKTEYIEHNLLTRPRKKRLTKKTAL